MICDCVGFDLQEDKCLITCYQVSQHSSSSYGVRSLCLLDHQETHKIYRQKLEELTNLQTTCSSAISKQRKCLKELRYSLTK